MKLLFCLFKYFPFGGLQRDFKSIARACQVRGHSIHVITTAWEGDIPQDFEVSTTGVRGLSNHRRSLNFAKEVTSQIHNNSYDVVIGFNKIPGLDVYYAADPCYKTRMKKRSYLYRLGGRYRTYAALENGVFSPSSKTHILLIAKHEKDTFIKSYLTPEERFHLLPPGISRDRISPANAGEIRKEVRRELSIAEDAFFLLMIGSSFKTKGLDRSLSAIAGLPESLRKKTKLFVIGEGKVRPFKRMARKLRVDRQLCFLGGRHDVPRFLLAADLLLHPAYTERNCSDRSHGIRTAGSCI
jgi:UDP-glucose:(heptosyl)LPS alpha-1,3-glucosyltransferase